MDTTPPLHRAIELLRHRRGWTKKQLVTESGVAETTLARIRDGQGGRADVLSKLERSLDIAPGTLLRVQRGDLTVEDLDSDLYGGPHQDTSVEFRLRSLEQAVADLQRVLAADDVPPSE